MLRQSIQALNLRNDCMKYLGSSTVSGAKDPVKLGEGGRCDPPDPVALCNVSSWLLFFSKRW